LIDQSPRLLPQQSLVPPDDHESEDALFMTDFDYDVVIRAGRIVCTATDQDGPGVVAVRGDRIVAACTDVDGTARRSLSFPDGLLLPGLIDLHAHPAIRGSQYGVDPDPAFLLRGTTTVLSQGDAGAENWPDYRRDTIENSRTRIRLAISPSKTAEQHNGPCFQNPDCLDIDACTQAIVAGGDLIWGVAVNVSRNSCILNPQDVLANALDVAERSDKPLLYGMRNPGDWSIADQLTLLRAGDVVTYIFRDGEWSIIGDDGGVLPEVLEARRRGVLFDACHGMQSFSFEAAEAAFAAGFYPDTISTDHHAAHVGSQPTHDLPRTMSKFLAAGMPEHEIFSRVGAHPAEILGLSGEVGTLTPGSCADLTVLETNNTAAPLIDTCQRTRPGGCWETKLVVRAGVIHSD
jgi:dihydroorotase